MCLACGTSIIGRSDKRYCDDGCRNSYNNKLNSTSSNFIKKINTILKRNRRILEEMLGNEKMQKVPREKMLTNGFDFSFFTNQLSNAKGQVYFFVYEYGYLPLGDEWFLIVKQNIRSKKDKNK